MSCIQDQRRAVARRYDRVASLYDLHVAPMDWLGGKRRRQRLLSQASGRVLEVGVGTGRNLPYYPEGVDLVGIDVSPRMLAHARRRAARLGLDVRLEEADVEDLPFPDASYDTVTATCVFCSVAHPVEGLREARRVVKPEGKVLLLEHVRPESRLWGWLFDRASPLVQRLVGPAIDRRTVENVRSAGLDIITLRKRGIWREIVARPSPTARPP